MSISESFRRIYLLSGTAPEIYGTGHRSRIPVLISVLQSFSRSSVELIEVTETPDRFLDLASEGTGSSQSYLKGPGPAGSNSQPDLFVVDARDLDCRWIQQFGPVLALDNNGPSGSRANVDEVPSADPAGLAEPAEPATIRSHCFPCLHYDTLLSSDLSLHRSVIRYLGPVPEPIPAMGTGDSSDTGRRGLLFYAGATDFLDPGQVWALDSQCTESFPEGYLRVGGPEPSASQGPQEYVDRLSPKQYLGAMRDHAFFLSYFNLSLYQAAASGCRVWGLSGGSAYHQSLIEKWRSQSGGPAVGKNLQEIPLWKAERRGWTLSAGALDQGPQRLRRAVQMLRQISSGQEPKQI